MQTTIFYVAILFSVLCFVGYLIVTLKHVPDAQQKTDATVRQLAPAANLAGATAQDVADMLKALASLTDSLVKAGPALWSLIGSILFLLIASMAAGLIGGSAGAGSNQKQANAANTAQTQANPKVAPNAQAPTNESSKGH